jgi:hypothetical protein
MVHVRREENKAAHVLPRMAVNHVMESVWLDEPPECSRDLIVSEQLAILL